MALLPLDSFRRILGYAPFHFFGLSNSKIPHDSACNGLVRQYAWQDADAIGRSEILQAIEVAEDRLREYLGYSVAPKFTQSTLPWPKYHNRGLWRYGSSNADGHFISVQLPEGEIISIGTELLTSIGTANVTYTDADSDGVIDTFSLTLATTITDPSQIAAYFLAADRLDSEPVGEKWQIKPVSVSISGGNVTIQGRSWLLVKPIKYEGIPNNTGLDPNDTASNFVSQLEVYQRTTQTEGTTVDTSQATLLWETDPCHAWFCACGSCSGLSYIPTNSAHDPAAVGKAIARCGIRDAKLGIVIPAQSLLDTTSGLWSAVDWATYREPDRVVVRYQAGLPLDNTFQMNKTMQVIVARLAAAEMGRRICACDASNRELYHWQFDLARSAGSNDEQYQISYDDLNNPLGTRRGQVYAWRQIRNLGLQGGLALI